MTSYTIKTLKQSISTRTDTTTNYLQLQNYFSIYSTSDAMTTFDSKSCQGVQ